MSATLMWEPLKRKANSLPDALKFVLRDKCGLDSRQVFGAGQQEYLRGLSDAGIDGARELLDAIEKYGNVEVWLEY